MSAVVERQVDLRNRNTLRVAATAETFLHCNSSDDVAAARALWPDGPDLVLGEGSNVLFVRQRLGRVLSVGIRTLEITPEAQHIAVRAGAGLRWHDLVMATLNAGHGGLENLSLIWGLVGAAPIQNIGAYGVEIAEFIEAVELYDWRDGPITLAAADCAFGYRDSIFKRWPRPFVITHIHLRLPRAWHARTAYAGIDAALHAAGIEQPTPIDIAHAVIALRQSKLPDPAVLPNAGSFFKNPIVSTAERTRLQQSYPHLPFWPQAAGDKLSAAWLIEHSGGKGSRSGDAGIAAQHALVLVNHGTASGAQLWVHAQQVAGRVADDFGIPLDVEPVVIN